jgi:hypothetical protein
MNAKMKNYEASWRKIFVPWIELDAVFQKETVLVFVTKWTGKTRFFISIAQGLCGCERVLRNGFELAKKKKKKLQLLEDYIKGYKMNKYSSCIPIMNEMIRYWMIPHDHLLLDSALSLDHAYLVGKLTNSKITGTKALEPLKSWHFCISNFQICWVPDEIWVVQD